MKYTHFIILDFQEFPTSWNQKRANDKPRLNSPVPVRSKKENTSSIYIYSLQNEYLSLAGAIVQRQLALIKPKLNLATILWKTFGCNCRQRFDTNSPRLFQQSNRVSGSAGLPERLQQQSDRKNGSWVTAALHGISSPQLGLIWVMGSYYDLADPTKWLNWFFGTNTAGSCQVLFRFHCIFQ